MNNVIELSENQKRLVEKLGVLNEQSGMQPAAARIASLLVVSPETQLTFDQLRETLNLSKSATSNALNVLQTANKIDYITKPGDRKRYFRSKISSWRRDIEKNMNKMVNLGLAFEEVLEQRPGNTIEFNQNMAELIDLIKFLNEQLPILYKKWEATRN